jgi:hypothetical protein
VLPRNWRSLLEEVEAVEGKANWISVMMNMSGMHYRVMTTLTTLDINDMIILRINDLKAFLRLLRDKSYK